MKGIILAGGKGSRLFPLTKIVNKQLLPVHDKPMIYYPLMVLMLAGIREILVVTNPSDMNQFKELLGDGSQLGVSFSYAEQEAPKGLAHALIVSKEFVGADSVCLILGDNIFYGQDFQPLLQRACKLEKGAVIFGYWVSDPCRYGVVELNEKFNIISIEEKPDPPKSNYAIPGLYFYDNDVFRIAESVKPSERGEFELSDINNEYLRRGTLKVELLGRGFVWLDAGTHEDLREANDFVATVERRQGLKIGCIEEVAYRMGFIDEEQVYTLAHEHAGSSYGRYLLKVVKHKIWGPMEFESMGSSCLQGIGNKDS